MQRSSDDRRSIDNFDFSVGQARENPALAEEFCELLGASRATEERHNIYLPDPQDLAEWHAVIVAWRNAGRVVSGLYVLQKQINRYYLGGVIADAQFRNKGLTRSLLRYTIQSLENIGPCLVELDVRIQRGELNVPAYRLFVAHGFRISNIKKHKLSSKTYEKHLFETAELGGKYIRSLRMQLEVGGVVEGLAA